MSIINRFSKRNAQADQPEISDWWKRLQSQEDLQSKQNDWMRSLDNTIEEKKHDDKDSTIIDVLKNNFYNPNTTDRKWSLKTFKQFSSLDWKLEYFNVSELIPINVQVDIDGMMISGKYNIDNWKDTEESLKQSHRSSFIWPLDIPIILADIPNDYLQLKNGLWLYDGTHRLEAHLYLNSQNVPAYVGRSK